ncbi:hypothetical protein [Celeribacter ethanolicus]|uniref:hypothetical protein n=1 Tax=Celeribacter ethanolicus TaxID=1758178 RepID=UPI0012FE101F|nr:hypothetical protein [Celeribacter ethanolicus]
MTKGRFSDLSEAVIKSAALLGIGAYIRYASANFLICSSTVWSAIPGAITFISTFAIGILALLVLLEAYERDFKAKKSRLLTIFIDGALLIIVASISYTIVEYANITTDYESCVIIKTT